MIGKFIIIAAVAVAAVGLIACGSDSEEATKVPQREAGGATEIQEPPAATPDILAPTYSIAVVDTNSPTPGSGVADGSQTSPARAVCDAYDGNAYQWMRVLELGMLPVFPHPEGSGWSSSYWENWGQSEYEARRNIFEVRASIELTAALYDEVRKFCGYPAPWPLDTDSPNWLLER